MQLPNASGQRNVRSCAHEVVDPADMRSVRPLERAFNYMQTAGRHLALGMLAAALASCGTEPICTGEVRPGVVVEIRDAFDDAPLAAGASGAVHDGTFVDSLRPYGSVGNGTLVSRAAADERPGEYRITLEHEGYLAWEGAARVSGDQCHVETVHLSVYLHQVP